MGGRTGEALNRPGDPPQYGVPRAVPGTSHGLRVQGGIWHPHSDDGPALDKERRRRVDLVQQRLQDARLGATRLGLLCEWPDEEDGVPPDALWERRLARRDEIARIPRAQPHTKMAEHTAGWQLKHGVDAISPVTPVPKHRVPTTRSHVPGHRERGARERQQTVRPCVSPDSTL